MNERQRDESSGPVTFWERSRAIRGSGLTPMQKLLLYVLAEFQGRNERAWPSQRTLADGLGVSVRHVRRLLGGLERRGLIGVQRRSGGVNRYAVDWARLASPGEAATDRGRSGPPPAAVRGTPGSGGSGRPGPEGGGPPDPPEQSSENKSRTHQRAGVSKSWNSGWEAGGFAAEEFASLKAGRRRFAEAVARRVCRLEDDLRFLTLWHYVGRQQRRKDASRARNPGGLFQALLKIGHQSGQWHGAQCDEDAAREFLRTDGRRRSGRGSSSEPRTATPFAPRLPNPPPPVPRPRVPGSSDPQPTEGDSP